MFLQVFHGTVEIHDKLKKKPQQMFVDASLYEVGAKWNDQVFSCAIPDNLKKIGSIVHFEAANILLTVRCF